MRERRRVISSVLTMMALLMLFVANLPFDYSFWDYLVLTLFIASVVNLFYEFWRIKHVANSARVE